MFEIFLIVIVLAPLYCCYAMYWKPKNQMKKYRKLLQNLGYKVHSYPFRFFTNSFIQEQNKGIKEHGDARYIEKNQLIGTDILLTNILNRVVISFINVDLQKELFSSDKVNLHHKVSFTFQGVTSVIGEGLIFSQEDKWRRKRKILSKVFTFEMLLQNVNKISQICDKVFDEIEVENNKNGKQFEFYIKDAASNIFSSVILKCFLGIEDVQQKIQDEKLPIFVVNFLESIGSASRSFPVIAFGKWAYKLQMTKKIKQVLERASIYKNVCNALIKQRKRVILKKIQDKKIDKPSDIFEALLQNHQQNNLDDTMNDEELYQEMSNFLLAGTDTTSGLFHIMIYFLGENPRVQKKVRQTIDEVIKSDADITHENLKKLEYIEWVQQESFRLGTPVAGILLRVAVKDHFINNIPIDKGVTIANSTYPNQLNPKYFKDPEEFRPERWESECSNLPPYVLLGFSGGPKSCIGKHLALLQSKIALIKLMKRYKEIRLPTSKRVMVRNFLYEPRAQKMTFIKK